MAHDDFRLNAFGGNAKLSEFSSVLGALLKRWALEPSQALALLGYQKNTAPNDLDDRIAYLLEISLGIESLYGDSPETEQRWLKEPHHLLDNTSPLDRMLKGNIADLVTVVELLRDERGL